MSNVYNWQLYDDWCQVAQDLKLGIASTDGHCLYLDLPQDLNTRFWFMLWTPLNKLDGVCDKIQRRSLSNVYTWDQRLSDLRNNHSDFHIEACVKDSDSGDYWFFPEVNKWCTHSTDAISRTDIRVCIERMLDTEHYDQYVTAALLKMPEESEEST
jgi:hypothetical protein